MSDWPPAAELGGKVRGAIKDKLVKERAQVEAGIGTVKHSKYGFTKPAARSAPAMAMCGQRAVLGSMMAIVLMRGRLHLRDGH